MRKRAVKPVVAAILGLLILFLYAGNNWIQVSRLRLRAATCRKPLMGSRLSISAIPR